MLARAAVIAAAAAVAPALGQYTSANHPMLPGNYNFPQGSAPVDTEIEKALPTINVQYRFNPSQHSPDRILAAKEDQLAFQRRLSDAFRSARGDQSELQAAAAAVNQQLSTSGRGLVSFLEQSPAGARIETAATGMNGVTEVMRGLAHSARPVSGAAGRVLIDPAASQKVGDCDRDYSQGCPEGFVASGSGCVASTYTGACRGEVNDFSSWSVASRVRWQQQCGAFWSCRSCSRDYSQRCPAGFVANGTKCSPTAAYDGACRGTYDFSQYNAAMLAKWSSDCGAFWSCAA